MKKSVKRVMLGVVILLVLAASLFAGISMRLQNGKSEIFSKSINMDSDAQFQSLKKPAKLRGV